MRTLKSSVIKERVKRLCLDANIKLRKDILASLGRAKKNETNSRAREILDIIIKNASIAERKRLAICQDTGMVVVYLKIGQSVKISGNLKAAIEKGVKEGYKEGYFRKSVVGDPFIRRNTNTNLPSIIYTQIVPGEKVDIRVVVKGFGCENTSKIKMFRPTASIKDVCDFVVECVRVAGAKACPPYYIGVGIGGTIDKAVSLSKEAVFRRVGEKSSILHIAKMEKDILAGVNKLKIGPMGAGGKTTALGASILTYPTHIAGMPVAVNISCHATRDAKGVL